MCVWLYMGYGLPNVFIDHLYTQLGSASNYSAIADLHTLPTTNRYTLSLLNLPCRTHLSNDGPRLAVISHQRPSLLFVGWLSTDNLPPDHFTSLHFTQPAWGPRYIAPERTQQKTPFFYCKCVLVCNVSFPRERVCWPVTKQRMFLFAIVA
jgi:hypothetical protein